MITQPQPKLFDIRVETMLPATLTYRILALSPEEALEKIKQSSPNNIKHRLAGKRDIKAVIYDAGTSIIRWTKNLAGR